MELIFFAAFAAGMCFGSAMFLVYGWYTVNKMKKTKEVLMDAIRQKAKEMDQKKDSIKDRLIKASELAQAQMAVKAQIEMPSKNALHSRYKNGLVSDIQDMEHQKLDILRTVLAEGFDPIITVINDVGGREEIPLSAYVNSAAQLLNDTSGTKTTPEGDPPVSKAPDTKKVGKFILHRGGKDDGTTH